MTLFHILKQNEWELWKEKGAYHPTSLDKEGFIHASTQEQVLPTANRRYSKQTDLLLLVINSEKVEPPIKFEYSSGAQEEHPHIYGELNLDAVIKVLKLTPNNTGSFTKLPQIK